MKPTFEKTVDILVKAYLNNTLMHGDCEACAVGNIVHAAGAPRYNHGTLESDSCGAWKNVFYTETETHIQRLFCDYKNTIYYQNGISVIELTGYHWEDLAKVEFAFETAEPGKSKDEWMFNGLMAVVDVLAEIHGIDLKVREDAKSLFVKV